MNFLYFAYGSNMLPARLTDRCSSARALGTARAIGYALEFTKRSRDRSGKATLCERESSATLGVVFAMDECDLSKLDEKEGVADGGYKRIEEFPVAMESSGETVVTKTYLATSRDASLYPYDWYLALIIAGAIHHGMDESQLAQLRARTYQIDKELDRDTRTEALTAMKNAGIEDYCVMLDRARGT